MNENIKAELFKYQEDFENISSQLNHLQNCTESLSDFIEQMMVSQDIVFYFEIIRYAIAGVKQSVDERIEQHGGNINHEHKYLSQM